MRKLLLSLAVVVGAGAACAPPEIKPPPPIVDYLFKEIFHSTVPDPTGVHAPKDPHSCMVMVYPADGTLHAPYDTLDPYWRANGWAFWVACVSQARQLGFALPAVKSTGDPNDKTLAPVFPFHLDTAPVFGTGSGHYSSFAATNVATWRRAYIEVTG